MKQPLISVIIPVYNMEQYVARCLDSVLNNTYKNLEIICVDDGSTDGSMHILRDYEKRDGRIVLITKQNGGVSSARNAGLERMRGDYVSFIDSDDYVHERYFETLLEAMSSALADYSVCQANNVIDNQPKPMHSQEEVNPKGLESLNCRQFFQNAYNRRFCTRGLIKASRIGSLRFRENMTYGEDTMFVAELWEQNSDMTACAISNKLYFYWNRDSSASKTTDDSKKIKLLQLFDKKIGLSERNNSIYLDNAVRQALFSRDISVYVYRDRENANYYTSFLRSKLPIIRKTDLYRAREKIAFTTFILFPRLHWEYTIKKDPSLRKWQKIVRERKASD